MIAIPLAFEQPATAARLQRAGVARIVPPGRAGAKRLKAEIASVLGKEDYRTRAAGLRVEIEAAGGVKRAADILEARLR
jgi:UDP:flavonoid glycosyltransferase YjiC (YdhE family)